MITTYDYDSFARLVTVTDHLGNNRVVVGENDSIEQINHYYPYGGLMAESTGGDTQRYKYNGKELDNEDIILAVENTPTYKRTKVQLKDI